MKSQTVHLCRLLQAAIRAFGLTQQEVERRLGVSVGYLSRLFGGQIDLKLDHVVEIAEVLEVEPEEIFRLAFPPSQGVPMRNTARLREAFGAPTSEAPPALPPGIEKEIERIVKRVLAGSRSSSTP